jgi:hypothetical protein
MNQNSTTRREMLTQLTAGPGVLARTLIKASP